MLANENEVAKEGIKQPWVTILLISNFRRVLYVVCFLLGNSPASEFYADVSEHSVPSS